MKKLLKTIIKYQKVFNTNLEYLYFDAKRYYIEFEDETKYEWISKKELIKKLLKEIDDKNIKNSIKGISKENN